MIKAVQFLRGETLHTVRYGERVCVLPVADARGSLQLVPWGCYDEDDGLLAINGVLEDEMIMKDHYYNLFEIADTKRVTLFLHAVLMQDNNKNYFWLTVQGCPIRGILIRDFKGMRVYIVVENTCEIYDYPFQPKRVK